LYVEATFSTPAALTFEWFMVPTPTIIATGASLAIPLDLVPGTHDFYVRISAEGVTSVYSNRATVNVIPYQCSQSIAVTFNLNGGSFTITTPPALTITSGSAIGILPSMPTGAVPNGISKDGYRFTGWFAYADGEFTRIRTDFIVTHDIEIIATWKATPNPSNFRVGDAGRDGRITSADATLIARHIVGHDVQICILASDIDGDGEVTIADIILLARGLVGHNVIHIIAH
jgi:uncharacterized repeat protein (TIGR02543 family)